MLCGFYINALVFFYLAAGMCSSLWWSLVTLRQRTAWPSPSTRPGRWWPAWTTNRSSYLTLEVLWPHILMHILCLNFGSFCCIGNMRLTSQLTLDSPFMDGQEGGWIVHYQELLSVGYLATCSVLVSFCISICKVWHHTLPESCMMTSCSSLLYLFFPSCTFCWYCPCIVGMACC